MRNFDKKIFAKYLALFLLVVFVLSDFVVYLLWFFKPNLFKTIYLQGNFLFGNIPLSFTISFISTFFLVLYFSIKTWYWKLVLVKKEVHGLSFFLYLMVKFFWISIFTQTMPTDTFGIFLGVFMILIINIIATLIIPMELKKNIDPSILDAPFD